MAAFACFGSSDGNSADAYQSLIQNFRQNAFQELEEGNIRTTATFVYFIKHRGKSTYAYKDFIYQLKLIEFNIICIILCENPIPHLTTFVRLVESVKLQDGRRANAYYGKMKKILTSFMNYFSHTIDDVVKNSDRFKHLSDDQQLMATIDNTMMMAENNKAAFCREFTIESLKDQEQYDEVLKKHAIYLEQLRNFREVWSTNKQDKIEAFCAENLELTLKKTHEYFSFTHTYISMMLGDRIYEIGVSVGDSLDRMLTNMRDYNDECTQKINDLIDQLYEKNKERLIIYRRHYMRSTDIAEVNRAIETLKVRIDHYGNEETIARLEVETRYWMKRMKEFNEIASILTKLRTELDRIEDEYKKTLEAPGDKSECFETIAENYKKKKSYLEDKIVETSKALITFFYVRGNARIHYTDSTGSYFCDEYNHQNYCTDYGRVYYHVNCYGDFIENKETEPYYFDDNGRYIIVNGEKIHQAAPCTSQYKLGDDGQFNKITKDCGHSEKITDKCRLEIKDLTDVEILPMTDIIDISGTLDSETVKYLWDGLGGILPEVLYKTAMAKPKNPIHYMAHILLKRRFEATIEELKELKKNATEYRKKIYKERTEKAAAETRAWRSKLVKRRKPEESDDLQDWTIYNQQVADWQFVNSLGYYN